jgi:hypothetical protein
MLDGIQQSRLCSTFGPYFPLSPIVWKLTGNAAPSFVPVSASEAKMRFTFKWEAAVMATVFGVPPMLGLFVAFMHMVLRR